MWTGSTHDRVGRQRPGDLCDRRPLRPGHGHVDADERQRTASAREWHTAVWTGTEMIVWGGDDRFNGTVNTGGRYTPATDTWQADVDDGAPSSSAVPHGGVDRDADDRVGRPVRLRHLQGPAVGTTPPPTPGGRPAPRARRPRGPTTPRCGRGSQMIVWGGGGNVGFMNTGGRYDPVANTWRRHADGRGAAGPVPALGGVDRLRDDRVGRRPSTPATPTPEPGTTLCRTPGPRPPRPGHPRAATRTRWCGPDRG